MRKKPSPATEAKVLLDAERRCALCFGLEGDLKRKRGQVAHIDQDPLNSQEDNLVYLCLEHHDEYDSKTRQVKGITEIELREYKRRLLAAVAVGEHKIAQNHKTTGERQLDVIRSHDERIFNKSDELMPESHVREFVRWLTSDDSYWMRDVRRIEDFCAFFCESGNQFINKELTSRMQVILDAAHDLLEFLALNFFVFPDKQHDTTNLRLCLCPDLHIDRGGYRAPAKTGQYRKVQEELDRLAQAFSTAYVNYRKKVKEVLVL